MAQGPFLKAGRTWPPAPAGDGIHGGAVAGLSKPGDAQAPDGFCQDLLNASLALELFLSWSAGSFGWWTGFLFQVFPPPASASLVSVHTQCPGLGCLLA